MCFAEAFFFFFPASSTSPARFAARTSKRSTVAQPAASAARSRAAVESTAAVRTEPLPAASWALSSALYSALLSFTSSRMAFSRAAFASRPALPENLIMLPIAYLFTATQSERGEAAPRFAASQFRNATSSTFLKFFVSVLYLWRPLRTSPRLS